MGAAGAMATLGTGGYTGKIIFGLDNLPHGREGKAGVRGAHGAEGQAQRLKWAGGQAGEAP